MNQPGHHCSQLPSEPADLHRPVARSCRFPLVAWLVSFACFLAGFFLIIPLIEHGIRPARGMVRTLDGLIPFGFMAMVLCGVWCLLVLLGPARRTHRPRWTVAAGLLAFAAGAGTMLSLWIFAS